MSTLTKNNLTSRVRRVIFQADLMRVHLEDKKQGDKKQGIYLLTCLAHLETQSLPQDSPWLEIEQLVNAPCGTMQPRLCLIATVQEIIRENIVDPVFPTDDHRDKAVPKIN